MSGFHHVELWVTDHAEFGAWRWLMGELENAVEQEWPGGMSWNVAGVKLVLTTSPNLSAVEHDRRRAGLNHLAFHGGSRERVDAVMAAAPAHGWTSLYHERYPHAGGIDHYAGWLENESGFKVEVVAG